MYHFSPAAAGASRKPPSPEQSLPRRPRGKPAPPAAGDTVPGEREYGDALWCRAAWNVCPVEIAIVVAPLGGLGLGVGGLEGCVALVFALVTMVRDWDVGSEGVVVRRVVAPWVED